MEEEPASPTRAPHATQEETYSISEAAAAREEDAMVAMVSPSPATHQFDIDGDHKNLWIFDQIA